MRVFCDPGLVCAPPNANVLGSSQCRPVEPLKGTTETSLSCPEAASCDCGTEAASAVAQRRATWAHEGPESRSFQHDRPSGLCHSFKLGCSSAGAAIDVPNR